MDRGTAPVNGAERRRSRPSRHIGENRLYQSLSAEASCLRAQSLLVGIITGQPLREKHRIYPEDPLP